MCADYTYKWRFIGVKMAGNPFFVRLPLWFSTTKPQKSKIISAGGDATENDDFQIGKQRLQGSIFYITGELVPFRDHRCTNSVHLWSRNGTNRCLI